MSPVKKTNSDVQEIKSTDKLPLEDWARTGLINFDTPPEIIRAALRDGKYSKVEVQSAIDKYLKSPAERG